jgi:hypothetical protein
VFERLTHASEKGRRVVPFVLLIAVVWLNLYIGREFFTVETSARMNSMQGFWVAMARWAGSAWWTPTWWPYWDGGMPFEYTYAPGIPALTALIAKLQGISELRALHVLSGLVFTLGPAALYLSLWRLTRSVPSSFAAAVAYSILSPALLIAPNQSFALSTLWNPERLYLIADWDELPHMGALVLWPIAVLCLFRIIETSRWSWVATGALVMSAMVYASAFGTTLLVISALCVIAATELTRSNLALIGITGTLTYLASCLAIPPSLMTLIRIAADSHGHGWSAKSWTSLALLGVVWTILLPWLHRRVKDIYLRFFILFTVTSLLIVWMYDFLGHQFIPQPDRYKLELSLGLAVTCVFSLRPIWKKLTSPLQLALVTLLVALAAEQIVAQRVFAKNDLWGKDITQTVEYRAAKWMDAHLPPHARVMLPGSMAQWLNAFSQRPQWTGGSWATAPNPKQQRALEAVYGEQGAIDGSLTWYRAFGVQAVAVSGAKSPEFWKPFADKTKYNGKLQVLWTEQDTTLYRVPVRTQSLAHAIPEDARSTDNWDAIKHYVGALDAERLPGLTFKWEGPNQAQIEGDVLNGEAVSVQVTHHAGWTATANGHAAPLESDGIGLIWIRPSCNGPCKIDLTYTGGAELILCRWVSFITLLALAMTLIWSCNRVHLRCYENIPGAVQQDAC